MMMERQQVDQSETLNSPNSPIVSSMGTATRYFCRQCPVSDQSSKVDGRADAGILCGGSEEGIVFRPNINP